MDNYCLYKHESPNGKVYIGITSQKPLQRWSCGNGYKNNSYFTRAIKKYGWDNFKHEIIFENLTKEDAKRLEIEYIKKFKSNMRRYGYNISSGGESKSGTKVSEYQKQRIREGVKHRVFTDSYRKKLSESTKRHWQQEGVRNHLREINLGANNPQYGKVRTDEEKIKRGAKRIFQYDMEMNLLNEYISIHKASEETGIHREGISKCCRGDFKQYKGYIWRFNESK